MKEKYLNNQVHIHKKTFPGYSNDDMLPKYLYGLLSILMLECLEPEYLDAKMSFEIKMTCWRIS